MYEQESTKQGGAFWLYSAKDWTDLKPRITSTGSFVGWRLSNYARSYHLLYIRTQMKK